jgi:XTP/dITP diphosphohydrolase
MKELPKYLFSMKILAATYNNHKVGELRALFSEHEILQPKDLGLGIIDIEENGTSYFENAMIKAKALFSLSGLPTLADDSGLSVSALDGRPGIFSSRYGAIDYSQLLSSEERNAKLLEEMLGVSNRLCAFYCNLVLIYGEDRYVSVQETCPGTLAERPSGEGGFGYDPLVYLPEMGCTVAELTPEVKNILSHRGRAARLMNLLIQGIE